jgi:hypothetical protein
VRRVAHQLLGGAWAAQQTVQNAARQLIVVPEKQGIAGLGVRAQRDGNYDGNAG